eukprot:GEMP01021662.1.p1 GENE.GEMP01021662.1~~GEMP01021662.1.p1  ORF type:complete len:217 (+),score=34.40 GEMP01021662.1:70-720(+)
MPIIYSLVAREKTVLAEYTSLTGNFTTITRSLLGKIPQGNAMRMSYTYDQYNFHYILREGLVYLCMADLDCPRRIPFAFLEELSKKFQERYADSWQTAIALAMQSEFQSEIERLVTMYNSDDADQIARVKAQINDIHDVMIDNIDKIMLRQEKIDILVEKTEFLNNSASVFRRDAAELRSTMYWSEKKPWIFGGLFLVLGIFFLVWYWCGLKFDQC